MHMGCGVLGVTTVTDPRDVLTGLDAYARFDRSLDPPSQSIVSPRGVIVEVDVPTLPAIIMLDDE